MNQREAVKKKKREAVIMFRVIGVNEFCILCALVLTGCGQRSKHAFRRGEAWGHP